MPPPASLEQLGASLIEVALEAFNRASTDWYYPRLSTLTCDAEHAFVEVRVLEEQLAELEFERTVDVLVADHGRGTVGDPDLPREKEFARRRADVCETADAIQLRFPAADISISRRGTDAVKRINPAFADRVERWRQQQSRARLLGRLAGLLLCASPVIFIVVLVPSIARRKPWRLGPSTPESRRPHATCGAPRTRRVRCCASSQLATHSTSAEMPVPVGTNSVKAASFTPPASIPANKTRTINPSR